MAQTIFAQLKEAGFVTPAGKVIPNSVAPERLERMEAAALLSKSGSSDAFIAATFPEVMALISHKLLVSKCAAAVKTGAALDLPDGIYIVNVTSGKIAEAKPATSLGKKRAATEGTGVPKVKTVIGWILDGERIEGHGSGKVVCTKLGIEVGADSANRAIAKALGVKFEDLPAYTGGKIGNVTVQPILAVS